MAKTVIVSNGSKWMGDEPDSVEVLLDVLKRETLDKVFEKYGNFVQPPDEANAHIYHHHGWESFCATHGLGGGVWHFSGNFRAVSHVFSIYTDDPQVIESLTTAIRENQNTDAYRNQPQPYQPRHGGQR